MRAQLHDLVMRFVRGDDGATAVEYGLLVSIVFLIALVGITTFGNAATGMWMDVANHV